ncbi:atrial natriuretic peptide receptor 1-like isoform X1 [Clavelina lepadiformis]|uniref:atrial natriuretic peptide receptor 1-like isoform X1 n=1 Tax=Clavelina lepadiformis TaxID=159417 RepID=UPI004042703D
MEYLNTVASDAALSAESDTREVCDCRKTELYYIIGSLSLMVLALAILSAILYRKYKSEESLRLTMWKVKWKDFTWDKNEANSAHAPPKPKSNTLESVENGMYTTNKRSKHYYTTVGYYKGRIVAVKQLGTRRMSLDRPRLSNLDQVFMLNHEHLCKFYGANYEGVHATVLTEYCTRGSLQDLLEDESEWDDFFKNSLIFDIVKGMLYLHRSIIGSHGNLKPSNCLIDSRFVVKITDFGMFSQKRKVKKKNGKVDPFQRKLWTAPEIHRAILPPQEGTQKGDVYSFAIIAQEILYQRGVFYRREDNFSAEEIIHRVTSPKSEDEIFRPSIDDDDYIVINELWREALQKCWEEKPKKRIGFHEIHEIASSLQKENTLIDSLLQRLQIYSNRLEEKVEEKTEQYRAEKERSDNLLYQMLPKSVADGLKMNMSVLPESYESVTVYFSDIVGFSAICHESKPLEVVQMLNDLYTMFDQIIDEFDVYKVETIGDAYMVVSGLPIRNDDNHACEIARMALRLRDSVSNEFVIKHMPDEKLKLRVGIHSGPVVAGVVGLKMPRYCLFGDTVNTAARMEQSGKELKIHISPHTKSILDKFDDEFELEKRKNSVFLKGIGEWDTWWLTCEKKRKSVKNNKPDWLEVQNERRRISSTSSNFSSSSKTLLTGDITPEYDGPDPFTFSKENTNPNCGQPPPDQRPNCQDYARNPNYNSWGKNSNPNKKRRSGVSKPPKLLFTEINLHYMNNRPTHYDILRTPSFEKFANGLHLDTVEENATTLGAMFSTAPSKKRKKRTGLENYEQSPRDSGVSMAFDNIACDETIQVNKA